jgi:menaquinone-9 beta-reductase
LELYKTELRNVAIIGGGIAGLISGILLARKGIACTVFEKKSYPFHRVCGEYISNEALPFLRKNELYPEKFSPTPITRFQLSSVTGKSATMQLDMGGFGISRFTFDNWLYELAKNEGVKFYLDTEVVAVSYQDDQFRIKTQVNDFISEVVIGSFGKRSKLDLVLDRDFTKHRSPYAGVKYHIRTDHRSDLIALHNFEGGYCGISNVESGKTNLCYLVHRDQLRRCGSVNALERSVLQKNPLLKYILSNSEFLFDKPEVINEISFATKMPVENHILMVGDAAGMITPLCGNGMAMAIHSAKIAVEKVLDYCSEKISRAEMEQLYSREWKQEFENRLWKGRQIQRLFGNQFVSNLSVKLALFSKPVARGLIKNTHGEVF